MLALCIWLLSGPTVSMGQNQVVTATSRPNFPHHLEIEIIIEPELEDEAPKQVEIRCAGVLIKHR